MPEGIQKEYQEILHQIHAEMFLRRLKHHLDPDGRTDFLENDASYLNDLVRRLQVLDDSPSIDTDDIQKLLEDEKIRDELLKATRNIMNSITEESEE